MTRQLVWIDTEKERIVPVEPTLEMQAAYNSACGSHVAMWFIEGAYQAALLAVPPATPVSLPSEEEQTRAVMIDRDPVYKDDEIWREDWEMIRHQESKGRDISKFNGGLALLAVRAIRKLLIEKGVG